VPAVPRHPRALPPAVRAAAAVAATVTLAPACADEADGAGGSGSGGTATISSALGALPAWEGDDLVTVSYGDLAAAAELAGVVPPENTADADAVVDYAQAITGQAVADGDTAAAAVLLPDRLGPRALADQDAFVDDVGFSLVDVDRYVERSTVPDTVTVFGGDFDRGQIDAALGDDEGGVWVAGDPDGDLRLDEITPARPLGEPLWLALGGDDRLLVARTEADMERARAADGGDGTLAGDEALASLAAALDVYDAYSALLVAGPGLGGLDPAVVLGEDAPDALGEALEDLEPCAGVTGVATGIADDGRPLLVLAVASASEDAATANGEVLEGVLVDGTDLRSGRPWSDIVEVETVGTEGAVTTITARPRNMPLVGWSRLVFDRTFPPC
jgi:hypothetical protein